MAAIINGQRCLIAIHISWIFNHEKKAIFIRQFSHIFRHIGNVLGDAGDWGSDEEKIRFLFLKGWKGEGRGWLRLKWWHCGSEADTSALACFNVRILAELRKTLHMFSTFFGENKLIRMIAKIWFVSFSKVLSNFMSKLIYQINFKLFLTQSIKFQSRVITRKLWSSWEKLFCSNYNATRYQRQLQRWDGLIFGGRVIGESN